MHKSSMLRMEWFANTYIENANQLDVLDVGSFDVNGSYKSIFIEREVKSYTGLDMVDGPNVDIVPKSAYKWREIKTESYDVVISGQALEHVEFFWVLFSEMVRVTKKGGIICVIVPNGFDEHRYPVDCWRFFTDGMIAMARYFKLEIMNAHTNSAPSIENEDWYSNSCADSMLIARKTYSGEAQKINLEDYVCKPEIHNIISGGMISNKEYQEQKEKLERVGQQVKYELKNVENNGVIYKDWWTRLSQKIKKIMPKNLKRKKIDRD